MPRVPSKGSPASGYDPAPAGERELARLRQRVAELEQYETLGQLAGGIVHDFNNLLAVIVNCAAFVHAGLDENHELRADLADIEAAATRAAALTRRLLIFSRRERLETAPADLNAVVFGLEGLMRRSLGSGVELVLRLGRELPQVAVDELQLEQVLLNLAVNARDALPTGGRVSVDTEVVRISARGARKRRGLAPGRYVRLRVKDDGSGMDQQVAERAFEPFFSTKPPGEGTGLGLATIFSITKQAGGYTSLNSAPAAGTTVEVLLPLARLESATPASLGPRLEGPTQQGRTVLLVDDDAGVRAVTKRILTGGGYLVIDAPGPRAALALARTHLGEIDLLLSDLVMPEMSGHELGREVVAARPDTAILYMSGYTREFLARNAELAADAHLIEKPFAADALLAAAADALGPAPTHRREPAAR